MYRRRLSQTDPVLLLQPRRVAARAIAQRIAAEQQWTIGGEVGWQVRFDRRYSAATVLLVATEGILTARLQQDPLLQAFRTVVLDEFHERSIHSDLGLALSKQAWLARDDLRIVVMSATLNATAVSAFLDNCPIIAVPGRTFAVDVTYRPAASAEDVVVEEMPSADGAVLAFLPGAREISRVAEQLARRLPRGTPILELHGTLAADQQDAALVSSDRPRVILATNIAETTLTVPDVRLVVDAGWQKVVRFDASRGLDRLETERVSLDAADQRAGRAGRVAPGRAIRLWDAHARLRPYRQPEIARVDLAGPAMDVLAWGGDLRSFAWFELPPAGALEAAVELLKRLGALDTQMLLTPLGHELHRFPLHPRLARLLLAAGGAPQAARAVALLSERRTFVPSAGATSCDLLAAVDHELPSRIERIGREVRETMRRIAGDAPVDRTDDTTFRRAVLAAYPDRVGRRRMAGGDRVVLGSGMGARLGRESGVVNHEFLVAVDVEAPGARPGAPVNEAIVRMATGIERDWLEPTTVRDEHSFDDATGTVRAHRVARYDAIVLETTEIPVDPDERTRLMTEALIARGPDEGDLALLARLAAAGVVVTFESVVSTAGTVIERIDQFQAAGHLPYHARQALQRDAPPDLLLPSGRRARLDYRVDGRIVAAVKLQELFGLAETPRIGLARVPVTFELLAPNGRPVQVTSDLRSFWENGYQEVRRELRARYPRHPWPEDPWTARATHRTVKRSL